MAIATLSIDIEARLASLQDGLDETMRSVDQSMGRLAGSVTAVGAALGALGGTVLAGDLVQFSAALVESIDALNDAADATGSTVERMSALDDFARRTGTTLASVTDVVGALNKALTKAGDDESKGIGQALKAINVDAEALRKLDPADALKTVADALSKFDDDGTKARLVQVIFKDAKTAMPILKDLADQQELVGRVTAAQAAEAEKAGKAWAALKAEGYDFGVSIANSVLPSLNRLIAEFKDASAEGLTLWQVLNNVGRTNGPLNDTWTVKAANARKELAALKADSQALTDWEKQAGSQDDYAQRIEKQQRLLAFYERRDKAATDSMANALGLDGIDSKPVINPEAFGAAGKAAKEAKAQVDEFAKVLEKIRGLMAKESGLDAGYFADLETLFAGYKKGRISLDEYRSAVDRLTKSQKFYTDGVAAKKKADEEAAKAQADYYDTWNKYLGSLDEAAVKLEEQAATYGLTSAAVAKLNLVRAEERLEIARTNGVADEYLEKLEQEVDARRRIATAAANVDALDANKRAADEAAATWKRVSDDIGLALTNSIFQGGKTGWEQLKSTIEATIIRAVVQPVVTGAVQSGLSAVGLGGSSGSGNGLMGTMSNVNTLSGLANNASIAYQWFNGSMSGANAGGTVFANTTGTGLDGLIASTEGWGTAPASGAGVSGWGAAGGLVGGALLGYSATDGNPLGTFAGGAIGTAGYGAVAGALSGAGAYAGATAALAAIPVWGWIALAALAIGGSMVTGGTPHMGGAYVADSSGRSYAANDTNAPGFGLDWGAYSSDRFAGFDSVAQASALGISAQVSGLIESLGGGSELIKAVAKFASDADDYSQGAIQLFNSAGLKIAELDKHYTEDANEAIKQWSADTPRVVLQALKASDLDDVFDALFKNIDPTTAALENINAALAEAATLSQAFAFTSDAALAQLEDASQSAYASFFKLGEALRNSAEEGKLSAQSIYDGIQSRYAAEVSLLADINSMIESIGAGFDSSIRSAQLSVLNPEGKYAFLDAESARYNDMLATLTDPALIGDYANRLRSNLDAAWALLDDNQRQTSLPDFLERYQAADDLAVSKLQDARKQVLDDQTKLISDLKTAMTEVYSQQSAAVQQIVSAIPERIALDINVNANGSVEVGAIEIAGG